MPKAVNFTIQPEPPDASDSTVLIAALDAHLNSLYRPEECHGLSVAALQDKSVIFLVARRNGVAAGCGAVKFFAGAYAEIKRMYVAPPWRGQGVAKAILAQLEHLSRQKEYQVLRLETGIYQPEAVALYERMGFLRCPAFGDYPEDGVSLCYEKPLDIRPRNCL